MMLIVLLDMEEGDDEDADDENGEDEESSEEEDEEEGEEDGEEVNEELRNALKAALGKAALNSDEEDEEVCGSFLLNRLCFIWIQTGAHKVRERGNMFPGTLNELAGMLSKKQTL